MQIPEIKTHRLRMRAFEPSDLDAYEVMMSHPDVTRYIGDGKTMSRGEAWRQMALFIGHWALRGYGIWAVEEMETRTLVGRIGFWKPEGWPAFELAYTLGKQFWGRGFAREGATAALDYARNTLGRSEIISLIRPDNTPSMRVAEALGASRSETIDLLGSPAVVFRYPRM